MRRGAYMGDTTVYAYSFTGCTCACYLTCDQYCRSQLYPKQLNHLQWRSAHARFIFKLESVFMATSFSRIEAPLTEGLNELFLDILSCMVLSIVCGT